VSEARNVQPPSDPVIPDKLYFRIGEVARLLNVETHTLRFWETEFPQLKVGKGGSGQRLYRRRDVELVLEIKHLLYEEGYTIPGARQFLQSRQRRRTPGEPTPAPPTTPPTNGNSREGGLHRIRAELRNLSEMLNDAPTNDIPGSAGRLSRNVSRVASGSPSRRGLHLASSKTGPADGTFARKPGAPNTMPGLFDRESE
jgi:DNA-binding transcriptional MerR regulator